MIRGGGEGVEELVGKKGVLFSSSGGGLILVGR